MVDRWHEKTIKNQEKKRENQKVLLNTFNQKLQLQLNNHAENKNQINALKTCSLNALEQSQKEDPELYHLYTQKALALFLAQNKEKK